MSINRPPTIIDELDDCNNELFAALAGFAQARPPEA
jgi:hypothetical protein